MSSTGSDAGALREPGECLLEHAELRAGRLPVEQPRRSERAQGLDERLVGQVRADERDRSAEEDLKSGVAGTACELGSESGLADTRFSYDEDARTAPRLCCGERALELRELTFASDEHFARASVHFGEYRAARPRQRGRL